MNPLPAGPPSLAPGSVLVAQNTLLPATLHLQAGATVAAWVPVAENLDTTQLGKSLAAAGWTFFFMAGTVRTTAFGFTRPGMIQAALQRLIDAVRVQHYNCLEIDEVATHSFLGLPYVSISAHPRHIQSAATFVGQ